MKMAAEQIVNSTNELTTPTTTSATEQFKTTTTTTNIKWIKNTKQTAATKGRATPQLADWRVTLLLLSLLLLHLASSQGALARAATAAAAAASSTASTALEAAGDASDDGDGNSMPLQGSKRQRASLEKSSLNMIQRSQLRQANANVASPNSDDASFSGNSSRPKTAGSDDHEQNRSLKLAKLTNENITCNDGSHAGFYLRKHSGSKKWIVFLEGGWHCYDNRSCRARWMRLRHLMTSAQWPDTRDVGGILSQHPEENPYWHNANHVLVPYCSSDSWSGTRTQPDMRVGRRFMGALILRQVIADLIPIGLGRVPGSELLLVGSSAGGLGVMLNLDRIRDFLVVERKLQVTVRGVSDSGWFLDREPYTPASIASSEAVRQGWKLWQGLLPEDCIQQHATEPWRCYFGYHLYPTLKTPLFVFQWLFDEAQMRADNVGAPVTPQQWNYIHEMGGALRSSLDNVSAVFAPSCIGHAVLSKRDWLNIKIDDISLPAALRCWEHATRRKRHDKLKRSTEATTLLQHQQQQQEQQEQLAHPNSQRHQKHRQRLQKQNDVGQGQRKRNHLTKEQREERKRRRQEQRQRRKQRRRQRQRQHENELANGSSNQSHNKPQRRRNQHKSNTPEEQRLRQEQRKRRRQQQQLEEKQLQQQQQQQQEQQQQQQQLQDGELQHEQPQDSQALVDSEPPKKRASANMQRRQRVPRVPEKCGLRLLERCSWPQCNHSCPTLTNPLTGEEMRFLELLASFGLDIEAVAAALGVDMHTLNNMDRTELVNLLTQQVS